MNLSLLCRHRSLDESFVCSLISIRGSSITSFLLLHQQSCDNHEVVGKHAATCLINDSVPNITVMVDLLSKGLDRNFRHHVDATTPFSLLEHLARVADHLLRGPDEFAIFRNLPLMPLFGRHSLDLLHSAPGAAIPIGESLHAVRKQVVEISDQARVTTRTMSHNKVLSVGW